jgi:hypothetical protein
VTACRNLTSAAEQLSDSMMRNRIYKLKLPQLTRFWDFSPNFVLCVCPQDQDQPRNIVKRDLQSANKCSGDSAASDSAHVLAVQGAQRWRHIHSASLLSIEPSTLQPLPPAQAAKVFSWTRSGKPAWESPDDASSAWRATFRDNGSSGNANANASPTSAAADEPDINRWVSKSVSHFSAVKLPVLYEIAVATGSEFGSGTDSQVFCILHGDDGSQSPELPLAVSTSNKDPFETGQLGAAICCSFEESVNLTVAVQTSSDMLSHRLVA